MGVHGLWKLLDTSGKPVPVEGLEGKVLAIDISIWIYQVLQGYQDRHGAPKPNAHLLGLFTRICKLLYYKIKPIFVFDGGVPLLKKNTIASRRKQKSVATNKAQKMKADLINNLIKHSVVKRVLNKDSKLDESNEATQLPISMQNKSSDEDMFALPDMPGTSNLQTYISPDEYDSDSSVELSPRKQSKWIGNIHNVDVNSSEFRALPADVRYDILTDLKETRKQNSWGRLHEMPEGSQEFSGFQLKRLLKRRYVQESLETAEKEMGGKTLTLEELDKLLTEQGFDTDGRDAAFRIAADSATRLIYISDKNALTSGTNDNATKMDKFSDTLQNENEIIEPIAGPSNLTSIMENISEYELDSDFESIVDKNSVSIKENLHEYTLDDEWEFETDLNESRPLAKKYFGKNKMNPALTYMLEYSGLSQKQIMQLIKNDKDKNSEVSRKSAKPSEEVVCSELPITRENVSTIKDNMNSELILSSSHSDIVQIDRLRDNSNVDLSDTAVTSNVTNSNTAIITKSYSYPGGNSEQIDTSDSDTDDFVEVQNLSVPNVNLNITDKKKAIMINIKSNEEVKDDIFADVFERTSKLVPTKSELIQSVETNDGNLKIINAQDSENTKNSLPKIIPEELISEKINIKSTLNDNDKVEDLENSIVLIDRDKVDLYTECDSFDECIKEKSPVLPTNEKDLIVLKNQLEDQQEELTRDIGKFERKATNISDQIRIEAQELLRLFGIPYVIAPMEAEAQCAFLEQINLTHGTVTDDSDIWLFGGQCVYKNFFNNNKRVLQFRSCDIQHHFKLSRNQMIQLALLVGSDYTTGVAGIGPVTALEILAAFPSEGDNLLHGLHNFSSWIQKGRISGVEKTGLRNKLRNVQLNKDFPSQAVVQAYLFPTVDESKEIFTWGKPNTVLLCDYARQKFGWTKGKFDDTMLPVLRRMEQQKNQKLLDAYLTLKAPKFDESNLSKRVQKALRRLNSEDRAEENVINEIQPGRSKRNLSDKTSQKEKKNKTVTEASITSDVAVKSISRKIDIEEYIPQREKDKASALKKKLHAIEVFRKSKQGLTKIKKVKCITRKVKIEADLSESDSD